MKIIEENLCDFRLGKDFLNTTPKGFSIKEKKNDKLNFTKIKNSWSLKDSSKRVKRQPTDKRQHLQVAY